jgi:hypothetical protein
MRYLFQPTFLITEKQAYELTVLSKRACVRGRVLSAWTCKLIDLNKVSNEHHALEDLQHLTLLISYE